MHLLQVQLPYCKLTALPACTVQEASPTPPRPRLTSCNYCSYTISPSPNQDTVARLAFFTPPLHDRFSQIITLIANSMGCPADAVLPDCPNQQRSHGARASMPETPTTSHSAEAAGLQGRILSLSSPWTAPRASSSLPTLGLSMMKIWLFGVRDTPSHEMTLDEHLSIAHCFGTKTHALIHCYHLSWNLLSRFACCPASSNLVDFPQINLSLPNLHFHSPNHCLRCYSSM